MTTMRFPLAFPLLLCLLLPGLAGAEESPAEMVRAEVAKVLAIVKDQGLGASARRHTISERIASRFDFEAMSQSILAVHWSKASPEQRERFITLYKKLLENIYVSAIETHTTQVVKVGGERYRGENATVIVTIQRDNGSDVPLLFKLKPHGDSWLVYDANVEGLSLVSHYRDRFGAIAASEGIDGVLAHLEEQTRDS